MRGEAEGGEGPEFSVLILFAFSLHLLMLRFGPHRTALCGRSEEGEWGEEKEMSMWPAGAELATVTVSSERASKKHSLLHSLQSFSCERKSQS